MQKQTDKEKYKVWDYVLLWGIVLSFLGIAYTNIFHYQYKMNADIASEAILASVICDSGEWIPKAWYASTEQRIFGTPNLAALFCGLTGNMSLSIGIACVLMTLGIMGSGYFFVSQCEFDRTQKLAFLLLCLVVPNHFVTLELMYLWAGYYSIHVIVLFLSLGIYIKLLKKEHADKKDLWPILLAVIFSFAMGMQGTRSILILGGPLLVTEVVRNTYLFLKKEWNRKKDSLTMTYSLVLLAAGYLGTRTSSSVGQEISRNIRKGLQKLGEEVLPDATRCVGLEDGNLLGKILLLFCILFLMVDVAACIWKMCKKSKMQFADWMMLFFSASPCMTAVFVAFTTVESSERYYFLLLYAIAFSVVRWSEKMPKPELTWCVYGLIILLFIANAVAVYLPIWKSNVQESDERVEVVDYLLDNNYLTAYASFENANSMTALANGNVRVAAVASVEKMDICKWLSSTEWYVPNVPFEEKTAYIVTETEREAFGRFLETHSEDMRYETQIGKFLIYTSNYNFSNLGEN